MAADNLIRDSADAITAPALLHVPWDDEVFPRAGQFELFELIRSPEKVLHARPGLHGSNHPEDEALWCQFLAHHLSGTGT
ncbi:hypothetical protein [Flexivirga endophytica]|nr:hypothetical protein [Flexivirga endophytica]